MFCDLLIRLEVSEYVTEFGFLLWGLEQEIRGRRFLPTQVERGVQPCRSRSWDWWLPNVKCITWLSLVSTDRNSYIRRRGRGTLFESSQLAMTPLLGGDVSLVRVISRRLFVSQRSKEFFATSEFQQWELNWCEAEIEHVITPHGFCELSNPLLREQTGEIKKYI
jgi:hypothetical protein